MKKISLYFVIITIALTACKKEYSYELVASGTVGTNCRISKIVFTDSATNIGFGSISASIDSINKTNSITGFDSLAYTVLFNGNNIYNSDTIAIDSYQYFIFDNTTKRIVSFHGLTAQNVPASPQYDVTYSYNTSGNLITKSYAFTSAPTIPFQMVTYTYTNGNLTHMESDDLVGGSLIKNADLTYNTTISPKNYMYLFPDEVNYAPYNQFFNFGTPSTNAVSGMTVRFFNPGSTVATDSTVSTFTKYKMSSDNYVLSVFMKGDDQTSIPATASVLNFSYHCLN